MLMIIAILKLGMRLRMIFSYHQFQDVAYDYWRHLSKLTCIISHWFSRRFVVFYCLTTDMFSYDHWRHLSKTRETEVDALALCERVTLVRADPRLPVPLADHDHHHHHNDDHDDDYHPHDNAADHDSEGDLDEDGVDESNNEATPSKIELEWKIQHQPPSRQIHQVQLGASYVLLA